MKRTGLTLTLLVAAPFLVATTVQPAFAQRTITEEKKTTTVTPSGTTTETEIVVKQAPPAPREEAMPAPPSPAQTWVPGYWTWNNNWEWHAGHFEQPPQPSMRWEPGHWTQRGDEWVWRPGHWR